MIHEQLNFLKFRKVQYITSCFENGSFEIFKGNRYVLIYSTYNIKNFWFQQYEQTSDTDFKSLEIKFSQFKLYLFKTSWLLLTYLSVSEK